MKITNVKRVKNDYLVSYNDSEYLLTEDVIIKFFISVGKEFSEFEFETIIEVNNYYVILNMLIKKLIKKPLTKSQIIDYLFSVEIFDTLPYIKALSDLKLINDKQIAQNLLYEAITFKKIGVLKLEQNCLKLGIDKNDYEFIFSEYTREISLDVLNRLLISDLKQVIKFPTRMYLKKITDKYLSKGFNITDIKILLEDNYDLIVSKINNLELIKKDLEKYHKLNKLELKKKLYSLGYEYDDIFEVLSED